MISHPPFPIRAGRRLALLVLTAAFALASLPAAALAGHRAPAPATNLNAGGGNNQATLNWNASSTSQITSYRIYRDVSGGTFGSTPVATVGASTTNWTDATALNGTTYNYQVTAVNSFNVQSSPSNIATATPTAAVATPCGTTTAVPATYDHVVWILMENHSYNEIIGNPAAPYINGLAKQCGLATNDFAISHPSLPNYIALTSGSTQGITDDLGPSSHPLNVPSIFSQLPGGGSRSLEESMPVNCDHSDSGEYAVRHNPETYFTNLGTDCANYDVPFGAAPDLSAKFTFVTPNLIDDMHDGTVQQGDQFLSAYVPAVLSSPQYQAGRTAVIITWDEDDSTQNNQVATLVIAPSVKPGTQSATLLNHYSILRTTEEQLGLPLLAGAATATSMRSPFGF